MKFMTLRLFFYFADVYTLRIRFHLASINFVRMLRIGWAYEMQKMILRLWCVRCVPVLRKSKFIKWNIYTWSIGHRHSRRNIHPNISNEMFNYSFTLWCVCAMCVFAFHLNRVAACRHNWRAALKLCIGNESISVQMLDRYAIGYWSSFDIDAFSATHTQRHTNRGTKKPCALESTWKLGIWFWTMVH